ncbi:MFS transporter [Dehalobacter sp. DCM]|uniref:MFS transporter n=1 Tax=Dehalobacter sp. DCM TaxID=2907827 RepID=UPI0030819BC3|nr:MFS transporter [Dehalobacter sp. DCM]
MSGINNQLYTSYRWVILLLMGLLTFSGNVAQFQVAAFSYQIIPHYSLTPSQYASVLNAPMLISVFLSLIGGSLADRYGVKNVVTVALGVSILGAFYRVYTDSYSELLVSMLLMGIFQSMLGTNASKIFGLWFPKKEAGVVMGIFFFISMAGNTVGLAISTYFPSTYSAFLTAAVFITVLAILWIVLAKNQPRYTTPQPVLPFNHYLSVAARSRNVWIGGLAALLFMGAGMSVLSFLPTALNTVYGMSPAKAGLMSSLYSLGTMFGSFIGPVIIEKVGKVKPVLISFVFVGGLFSYSTFIVPVPLMWLNLFIAGLVVGGILPNIYALPLRLKEIGPIYAGSAGGIISTLQMLGAFVIPTFVVGTIAGSNYNLVFILSGCIYLAGIPLLLLLPNINVKEQLIQKVTSV